MTKIALDNFLKNHSAKGDRTLEITHTRIGDKDLNIFAGAYSIPENKMEEFYSLYKKHIKNGGNEYLTEVQLQPKKGYEDNGQMMVDLDFRYSYDVEVRQHTKENIDDVICAYLEEFKKYFVFDCETIIPVWIMEKPNVNMLEDKSLTKDGIHLVFGLSVPYNIQLEIRDSLIEIVPTFLELPLTNSWESVFDAGISKGNTNWMLYGSQKPANECYKVVKSYQVAFDTTDGEFMLNSYEFDFDTDFEKLSARYKATKYPFNPNLNIETLSVSLTKTNFIPTTDNKLEELTNFDELKFYAENGAFKYCMGTGCHVKWIAFAGTLVSILPIKQAFEIWKIANLINGTSNKKDEYENKFNDIQMLMDDPIKAYNSLKKTIKKEAPIIFNDWKEKQQAILAEWRQKTWDEIKAKKEELKAQKELEKEQVKAQKEELKAQKEEARTSKQEMSTERDALIEHRKNQYEFIDNDNDACDIIFEKLKDCFIFVNDRFYYKFKNCWIYDTNKINSLLMVYIAESNIYKINEEYDLKPYGQNTKTAKNIMELLYAKIRVKCDTKIKYSMFHSSTKNKLCFIDGVLDFKNKSFTLWENLKEPIYTTIIIERAYLLYFNEPNVIFINKIKDDIFTNLFGTKTNLALKFFSRAISGNCADKNFMSFMGNRNCGKGILFSTLLSAFENYITSFSLDNFTCKRESSKGSDIAKENAHLIPLEYARVAISQETDENENDNIKEGLKISNKKIKSIMSGGDEIEVRPLYSDPYKITLDATLCALGNNELVLSGEDGAQHHLKFNGVKQFITQEKYDSYKNMGEEFLSSYAVRDEILKDKIKTEDYMNAMVYLLYENYTNKCITIDVVENDDGEEVELSIRALIFKHYEITKDDKDRVSKDDLINLISKDKKKITNELKQLGCIGSKDCKMTIIFKDENGNDKSKQIQAFKRLKLRAIVIE